jgi:hypothetical protein
MKKIILLTATLLVFLSYGQTLSNQVSIGGDQNDGLTLYSSPNSNGYYLIGNSYSNISGYKSEDSKGDSDIWIVKTDNDFNKEWDKTIGGDGSEYSANSLVYNGGIFLLSWSSSEATFDKEMNSYGDYDIWLLYLDLEGNIIWQRQYGGDKSDIPVNVFDYTDTSLLISSYSNSGISGNKEIASNGNYDIWLLEVSKVSGNIIQEKSFGGNGEERGGFISKNPYNNNIYISGTSNSEISGNKTEVSYGSEDIWLVELDENLDIIKQKIYGGTRPETSSILLFTEDAIYLAIGSSSQPSGNKTSECFCEAYGIVYYDIWFLKLDYNLSIIWDKTYGGNADDNPTSSMLLPNGNILISSYSMSGNTGNKISERLDIYDPNHNSYGDVWVFVVNSDGEKLQEYSFGGSLLDYGEILKGNNNEYILSAYSESPVSGNKTVHNWGDLTYYETGDLWLAKVDMSEILSVSSLKEQNFSVYPNPVNNTLFISSEMNNNASFQITDLLGNIVKTDKFSNESSLQQIDISELNSGMYILLIDNFRMKFLKTE